MPGTFIFTPDEISSSTFFPWNWDGKNVMEYNFWRRNNFFTSGREPKEEQKEPGGLKKSSNKSGILTKMRLYLERRQCLWVLLWMTDGSSGHDSWTKLHGRWYPKLFHFLSFIYAIIISHSTGLYTLPGIPPKHLKDIVFV